MKTFSVLILLNLFNSFQFQETFKGQKKVDLDVFALPDVCKLELELGSCQNKRWRWYYNDDVRECRAFLYNGCHGNGNNFVTKSACENTCRSICNADNLISPCLKNETRWVYDPTSNTCKQMSYGGCEGHGNRFHSRRSCLAKCDTGTKADGGDEICDLGWDRGVSNDISATTNVWYYDKLKDECFTFTYLGTAGNRNRFKRRLECVQYCKQRLSKKNRCEDTVEYGNCGANQLRWHYDGAQCRPFYYSGCGGNFNNFGSRSECLSQCTAGLSSHDIDLLGKNVNESCFVPPETGECRADIKRWFYDPVTSTCQIFSWGGCPSTQLADNNFESAEHCQLTCGGRTVTQSIDEGRSNFRYEKEESTSVIATPTKHELNAECRLQRESGPCRASFRRFYYDINTDECALFVYGGCMGNGNNFGSFAECRQKCKKEQMNAKSLPQVEKSVEQDKSTKTPQITINYRHFRRPCKDC